MIKVWSTYPPAVYQNPMTGMYKLAGGTISKLEVDGMVVPVDTPIPEGLDLGWFTWMAPVPRPAVKETVRKVTGSGGKVYTIVRLATGKETCSCPGFQYRRFCKHTGATK